MNTLLHSRREPHLLAALSAENREPGDDQGMELAGEGRRHSSRFSRRCLSVVTHCRDEYTRGSGRCLQGTVLGCSET